MTRAQKEVFISQAWWFISPPRHPSSPPSPAYKYRFPKNLNHFRNVDHHRMIREHTLTGRQCQNIINERTHKESNQNKQEKLRKKEQQRIKEEEERRIKRSQELIHRKNKQLQQEKQLQKELGKVWVELSKGKGKGKGKGKNMGKGKNPSNTNTIFSEPAFEMARREFDLYQTRLEPEFFHEGQTVTQAQIEFYRSSGFPNAIRGDLHLLPDSNHVLRQRDPRCATLRGCFSAPLFRPLPGNATTPHRRLDDSDLRGANSNLQGADSDMTLEGAVGGEGVSVFDPNEGTILTKPPEEDMDMDMGLCLNYSPAPDRLIRNSTLVNTLVDDEDSLLSTRSELHLDDETTPKLTWRNSTVVDEDENPFEIKQRGDDDDDDGFDEDSAGVYRVRSLWEEVQRQPSINSLTPIENIISIEDMVLRDDDITTTEKENEFPLENIFDAELD